jgi:hypothetical protein
LPGSSDILARMGKAFLLLLFLFPLAPLTGQELQRQVPCPILLTSASAGPNSIKLSFRNRGKLPIEQFSLTCTPPSDRKLGNAVCDSENGLFYPGNVYWTNIAYAGANRHSIVVAVHAAHLAEGAFWTTRSPDRCRSLRVTGRR